MVWLHVVGPYWCLLHCSAIVYFDNIKMQGTNVGEKKSLGVFSYVPTISSKVAD